MRFSIAQYLPSQKWQIRYRTIYANIQEFLSTFWAGPASETRGKEEGEGASHSGEKWGEGERWEGA